MADDDKQEIDADAPAGDAEVGDDPSGDDGAELDGSRSEASEADAAKNLGVLRYVLAGFFATAIGAAFVLGKTLAAIWGRLAEARWFQNSLHALAAVGEEERAEISTTVGAVVALVAAVYAYRRPDVRQWTNDVAGELAKVTWPDKAEVVSSTLVVIVTGAGATLYLALLDRFWGFVTGLVYGGS